MSEQSGDSEELPEWAVKQAAGLWDWGCECSECFEGSQKAIARALVETREKALEEAAELVKKGTTEDAAQYPGSLGIEPEGYYSWRFIEEIRALSGEKK